MLETQTVHQFDPGLPGVLAFRIDGEVPEPDLNDLADYANQVFGSEEACDMLLVFDRNAGACAGARLAVDVASAQADALALVENCVVVNAPEPGETLVRTFERAMRGRVRSFTSERKALAYLERQVEHG